jgi:hypothetical protein
VFDAVRWLLDAYEKTTSEAPENRMTRTFLILAATVAQTPEVPVPDLPALED